VCLSLSPDVAKPVATLRGSSPPKYQQQIKIKIA